MCAHSDVGSEANPLRVAVVGSGPGGFYAVEALLKSKKVHAQVDLFDRLPTPYGLVRGGVAPDHQKIKAVIRVFEKVAENPNFRFFGNVKLGRDIQVEDLTSRFHQIVYAVGNESDKPMGIPGEDLGGVAPATAFVGWYNGHPDWRDMEFDLSCDRVAVVGIGNVAVDVTRILAHDPEDLVPTDIADHALEALRRSRVKEIFMLGRRGPVQAAFSPKEIKELGEMNACDLVIDPRDLDLDEASRRALEEAGPKSDAARNLAILQEHVAHGEGSKPKKIRLRLLTSPVEVIGDGCVKTLKIERNELVEKEGGYLAARGTGQFEEIEVGLVFPSIGYRGIPLPGVPFEDRWGLVPNEGGRVTALGGEIIPNQYVVGWMKSGPKGLIGMHRQASGEVVGAMLEDVEAGKVTGEARDIQPLLEERGIRHVTFDDWKKMDALEIERGKETGSVRRKFTTVPEMLEALNKA
jgi:ferredoxin--NADP+ reductase